MSREHADGSEVLIVAGEPSGDALAAELVTAARERAPGIRFFGAAGPDMERAGVEPVVATSDLAVMGLVEVVARLPAIRRAMRRLEEAAARRAPIGAILVDSPDFNLRLARRLARRGIPVVQYVSPTVWAWRRGRIRTVRRWVRRLLATLPFEPEVYAGRGVDVVYVGNPAVDRIPADLPPKAEVAAAVGADPEAVWIGLLPGSREGELARMGPALAGAARRLAEGRPGLEFLATVAPGVESAAVAEALAGGPAPRLVADGRLAALGHCAAAIATSGTVSLELALLGVPHVVGYRTSTPTWLAARALVDVPHVALPNLIAGRAVVPELLQAAATPEALAAPVATWLADPAARETVRSGLAEVGRALGPPGVAARAARAALEALGEPLAGDPGSGI